jgi:hypothetical protein
MWNSLRGRDAQVSLSALGYFAYPLSQKKLVIMALHIKLVISSLVLFQFVACKSPESPTYTTRQTNPPAYTATEQESVDQIKQKALNTTVSINYKNKKLQEVLDDLSEQSSIEFRYGEGVMETAGSFEGSHTISTFSGKSEISKSINDGIVNFTASSSVPLDEALTIIDEFETISYVYRPGFVYIAVAKELKSEYIITRSFKIRNALTRENIPSIESKEDLEKAKKQEEDFNKLTINTDLSRLNLKEMLTEISKDTGIKIAINNEYLKEAQSWLATEVRGSGSGGPIEYADASRSGWKKLKTTSAIKLPEFFKQFFYANGMKAKIVFQTDKILITPTPLDELISNRIKDTYIDLITTYDASTKTLSVTFHKNSIRYRFQFSSLLAIINEADKPKLKGKIIDIDNK